MIPGPSIAGVHAVAECLDASLTAARARASYVSKPAGRVGRRATGSRDRREARRATVSHLAERPPVFARQCHRVDGGESRLEACAEAVATAGQCGERDALRTRGRAGADRDRDPIAKRVQVGVRRLRRPRPRPRCGAGSAVARWRGAAGAHAPRRPARARARPTRRMVAGVAGTMRCWLVL